MAQIIPHFDFRIATACAQELGSRDNLEDAFLVAPETSVFAVADGMGGHAAGEVAAALALEEVLASIRSRATQKLVQAYVAQPGLSTRRLLFSELRKAVVRANQRVREEASKLDDERGMGTTVDVVWLIRDRAFVAHAGDGRVYLARTSTVLQLTQDHAQLESLKAQGTVAHREKQSSANRLLNAVGLKDDIVVDTLHVDLNPGDRLMLCSDGVHGPIESESRLGDLIRQGSVDDAARTLVREGVRQGRDNATALIVEVRDRFVQRGRGDPALTARDLEQACATPLLGGLPQSQVFAALAAAVEIELAEGDFVPRSFTNDLVAYIVLDGMVRFPSGRTVGSGALVFPESLVDVGARAEPPTVIADARLLRLRGDDFREVCNADPELGNALYRRLAEHLARNVAAQTPRKPRRKPSFHKLAAAPSTRTSRKG